MENDHLRQEIAIIKAMIEKTKRETAESGRFFIFLGFFSFIATFAIGILEEYKVYHLVLPILITTLLISGIISYFTISREGKTEKVKTYSKTIYWNMWYACGIPCILIMFLFPLTNVYPYYLVPMFVSLFMGTAIFLTGVVFEIRSIKWCGLIWWAGACFLAYAEKGMPRVIIMMGLILTGWILPGFILNNIYKNRSKENGS